MTTRDTPADTHSWYVGPHTEPPWKRHLARGVRRLVRLPLIRGLPGAGALSRWTFAVLVLRREIVTITAGPGTTTIEVDLEAGSVAVDH